MPWYQETATPYVRPGPCREGSDRTSETVRVPVGRISGESVRTRPLLLRRPDSPLEFGTHSPPPPESLTAWFRAPCGSYCRDRRAARGAHLPRKRTCDPKAKGCGHSSPVNCRDSWE